MQSSIHLSKVSKKSEITPTHRHTATTNKHLDVVYHRVCVCTGFCMGLLSCMLNWKQVQRKDLITFAAHYPVTVCTYLPLCVLINQAQTTLSAPLHFSTWLATSNSRAQQPDETTCCCLLFQHLQCKRSWFLTWPLTTCQLTEYQFFDHSIAVMLLSKRSQHLGFLCSMNFLIV